MSHKKFGPDRFSRFDVYWIQTNKQTDKQTDKPNLYIDVPKSKFIHKYRVTIKVDTSESIVRNLFSLISSKHFEVVSNVSYFVGNPVCCVCITLAHLFERA